MHDKTIHQAAIGLASLTVLQNLIEILVKKRVLMEEDVESIFQDAAALHEKAAESSTTNANADAALALRKILESILSAPELTAPASKE